MVVAVDVVVAAAAAAATTTAATAADVGIAVPQTAENRSR
jgi:hypothetical protein